MFEKLNVVVNLIDIPLHFQ